MKININDYVRVKLTDKGRRIFAEERATLNRRFPKFNAPTMVREDKDGYSKWQLWVLIETFGPYVGLGKDVPFTDLTVGKEEQ